MNSPTFLDVLRAKRIVDQYLPRTPLHHYPLLDELVGALKIREQVRGKIIALILSGGNISPEQLRECLNS